MSIQTLLKLALTEKIKRKTILNYTIFGRVVNVQARISNVLLPNRYQNVTLSQHLSLKTDTQDSPTLCQILMGGVVAFPL